MSPAERCYACDGAVTGLRDRRPEGGKLEPACPRHADPTLPASRDDRERAWAALGEDV